MRPGRFDRKIFLGACVDSAAKVQIFAAQTRQFTLSTCVDFAEVVRYLEEQRDIRALTGADIGSISTSAYSRALDRLLNNLTKEALIQLLEKTSHEVKERKDLVQEVMDSQVPICSLLFEGGGVLESLSDHSIDSNAVVSAIKCLLRCLPRERMRVVLTQEDFLVAASNCKTTQFDESYYNRLQSQYEDS